MSVSNKPKVVFSESSDSQIASTKPVSLSKKGEQKELGATGTNLVSGYIRDDYNSLFVGRRAYDTYDEMYRSDSTIHKMLEASYLPILGAEWSADPFTDSDGNVNDKDKEIAMTVEKMLFEDLEGGWQSTLFQILNHIRDGVSVFEKVWDLRDSLIVLKKLGVRLPSSIERRETQDGCPGITQILPNTDPILKTNVTSIPAEKLVIFSLKREGNNYAGISILRPIAKDWVIKKSLTNFLVTGFETHTKGVRMIRVPSATSKDDKDSYLESVASYDVGNGNTIVLPGEPNKFDFDFKELSFSQSKELMESIKYFDANMSDIMLGLFMKLGESQTGSYGMSKSNIEFFLMGLRQIAKNICDTINKYIIKEFVDMNYSDVDGYPTLTCGKIGRIDTAEFAEAVSKLTSNKLITRDHETEQWIRQTYNIPLKTNEATEEQLQGDPVKEKTDKEKEEEIEEFSEKCCTNDDLSQGYFDCTDSSFYMENTEDMTSEELVHLKKKGKNFQEIKGFRPLTFAEEKVKLDKMKKRLKKSEEQFQKFYEKFSEEKKADIMKQVRKAVEKNDINALSALKIKGLKELSREILNTRQQMFDLGKDTASSEIGASVPSTTQEQKAFMKIESDALAKRYAENIESSVQFAVNQEISRNAGEISTLTGAQALRSVGDSIDSVVKKSLAPIQTVSVIGSLNTGRGSSFSSNIDGVYAFQYSAILDSRTTDRCMSLDGRVVAPGSPEFSLYTPPQHYNCRSIWVAILNDETLKPKITGIPKSIPPVTNVANAQQLKKPVLLKNSPARKQLEDELKIRKEKLAILEAENKFPNRQKNHKDRIKKLERVL